MSRFGFDKYFNLPDGQCIIKNCNSLFDCSEGDKEKTISYVFRDLRNDKLEVVLTKVVLLNEFYSTYLNSNPPRKIIEGETYPMDVVKMAHHILSWNQFNEYCFSTDPQKRFEAVEYIRRKPSEYRATYHKEAYSFATKYCCWHNPDCYPIVDSYSKGMLYYLNREFDFCKKSIRGTDLNDYPIFCHVYNALQKYLSEKCAKQFGYRQLDKFLWYYGKNNGIVL